MVLTAISVKRLYMKFGYLILASERRVLNVTLHDGTDAIQQTIGCRGIEHGTTLASEDQLFIDGNELHGGSDHQFWVCGVPFPFYGNAILIGVDPMTGHTAYQPAMELDSFRRQVSFTSQTTLRLPAVMEALFDERWNSADK